MTRLNLQRRAILVIALVVVIAGRAVFGVGNQAENALIEQQGRQDTPKLLPPETKKEFNIALDKLTRTSPAGEGVDLFAPKSWYVPPPAPVAAKVTAPLKPVAPRLPYAYVGQIEDKDGLKVILMRGDEMVFAAPGATLDANYRLDLVTVDQLVFVYVPLGEKQILMTGGK